MSFKTRWKRNLDRIRTEPGLKKNVIVIGTLIVLALVSGSVILGNQRFTAPWADRYQLSAEFEATPGIAPGNGQEVRMNGVIVGQITGARVGDEGRAVVDMELEPEYSVHEDAVLTLRPKSPLNEMYVTINPGTSSSPQVPSGSTLPVTSTSRPIQIDEVLGYLDDGARTALTSLLREADAALVSAPEDLPAGLDAVDSTMTELRPVIATLDERRELLRRLVTAVSAVSESVGDDDQRLLDLAGSLDATLGVVADEKGALSDSLDQLPDLTRRLGTTTQAVERLSSELDPTLVEVHRATDELPGALNRLTSTSKRLRETVQLARPVIADARPVVADLLPYTGQLKRALPVLERSTARLDPVTSTLTKYLPDLGAFFVNTRSLTSMRDANGGILRGMLEITPTSLPFEFDGLAPDEVEGPQG
ncbi:MlaD family protein [Nocardioides sp.]|uniref:MlaD family protein n=1 Tax=Nocardioides sp. TaxID=35761 RepID=UPI00321B1E76